MEDMVRFPCFLLLMTLLPIPAALGQPAWSDAEAVDPAASLDTGTDSEPSLANDGSNRWMAVWISDDTRDDTVGTDWDVFGAISLDNGNSWSPSFTINSAETDSGDDFNPIVATDGAGRWLVVWVTNDPIGNTGEDYDLFFSYSDNQGTDWTTPAPIPDNTDSDTGAEFFPSLDTDGQGNWVCTWQSNDPGFNSSTDNDIYVARSADNGATWSAHALLQSNGDSDAGQDNKPIVVTDGRGVWITAWESNSITTPALQGNDDDILFSRSEDLGATWSAPAFLNSYAQQDSFFDANTHLATDGAGNWLAVWDSRHDLGTNGTDSDIMSAFSTNSGATWSSARTIDGTTDAISDSGPHAAYAAGTWLTFWTGSSDPGDSGADSEVYVSASTNLVTGWSARGAVNHLANTDNDNANANNDFLPAAGYNAGRWIAVWTGHLEEADSDILFAVSPPDCVLPDSFTETVGTWGNGVSVLDLVQSINTICGVSPFLTAKQR